MQFMNMQIKQAELVTEQQTGTDNILISAKSCHTVETLMYANQRRCDI